MEYARNAEMRGFKSSINEQVFGLGEQTTQAKLALQNHTEHITKVKKQMQEGATKKDVREVADKMKRFALNVDLTDLYKKTVPHVATMEAIGREMTAEVDRL